MRLAVIAVAGAMGGCASAPPPAPAPALQPAPASAAGLIKTLSISDSCYAADRWEVFFQQVEDHRTSVAENSSQMRDMAILCHEGVERACQGRRKIASLTEEQEASFGESLVMLLKMERLSHVVKGVCL